MVQFCRKATDSVPKHRTATRAKRWRAAYHAVFALVGGACGGIRAVGTVDPDRPTIVSSDFRGPRKASLASSVALDSGDMFALIDAHDNRYSGLVRVTGPSLDRFCEDCGGQTYFDAELVEGRIPMHALAVGPVSGRLKRARVLPKTGREFDFHNLQIDHFSTGWIATTRLDLDGNGKADLELVTRCQHAIRTSPYSNGCDHFCDGTRWAGSAEPQPSSVHCYGSIPDVRD